MSRYISVIRESFLLFPFIALLFTVPYMIYNYRKYGSVWSLRILVVYSFILYLMTVLFLVILPLPSMEQVANMTGPSMQLDPMAFVKDILEESPNFNWKSLHSWLGLRHNYAFMQFAFNVLMTMPFGMYLRYYFRKGFWTSVLLSFLLSLFFELTQLTGDWFIYPRSYRLFDVDDLIANTLGGTIGYILMIPLSSLLPSRQQMDADSYRRGRKISLTRRLLAMFVDVMAGGSLAVFAGIFAQLSLHVSIFPFYSCTLLSSILFAWISRGQTLGMMMTNMSIVSVKGRRPAFWRLCLRFLLEYGLLFSLWDLLISQERIYGWFSRLPLDPATFGLILLGAVAALSAVMSLTIHQTLFGWISGTKIVSDVRIPEADQLRS